MSKMDELSKYLCFILRHEPSAIGVSMDTHGWVQVDELIDKINKAGKYELNLVKLRTIVVTDEKNRYQMNDGKIRCRQGHSISWVKPDLTYKEPPITLYHGTSSFAAEKIIETGQISRMKRHHVHLTEDPSVAWNNASRWSSGAPTLLVIDAYKMYEDGKSFGVTDNDVWCTMSVPTEYISKIIADEKEAYKIISEYKRRKC